MSYTIESTGDWEYAAISLNGEAVIEARLYGEVDVDEPVDGTDDEIEAHYAGSLVKLEALIAAANAPIEAIARIQRLRDEAQQLLDDENTIDEAEEIGAIRAYDSALDILQLLAHGITPEQGK